MLPDHLSLEMTIRGFMWKSHAQRGNETTKSEKNHSCGKLGFKLLYVLNYILASIMKLLMIITDWNDGTIVIELNDVQTTLKKTAIKFLLLLMLLMLLTKSGIE